MPNPSLADRALGFAERHIPGRPLVLINVWDVMSALTVAKPGAAALATSSWAVADAHGLTDGEMLPFEAQRTLAAEISKLCDLPLTVDLERGYAEGEGTLQSNVEALIEAGVVGVNLEDGLPQQKLRDAETQARRISAVRSAADAKGVPLFLNARTDLFFVEGQDAAVVESALERAALYVDAGASGLFAPGLTDPALIETLCARSPLPVNVMSDLETAPRTLAELGVARISVGPAAYLAVKASLARLAEGHRL